MNFNQAQTSFFKWGMATIAGYMIISISLLINLTISDGVKRVEIDNLKEQYKKNEEWKIKMEERVARGESEQQRIKWTVYREAETPAETKIVKEEEEK